MEKSVSRKEISTLLSAALIGNSFRFAIEAAGEWLKSYPGDMDIIFLFGKALAGLNRINEAISVFESLVQKDPEYLEAHEALAKLYQSSDEEKYTLSSAYIHALTGLVDEEMSLPVWSRRLAEIRLALQNDNLDIANSLFPGIQNINPPVDLVGITQMQIAAREDDLQSILQLGEIYQEKFPKCLHFPLWIANSQMQSNTSDGEKAVSLLHQCAAKDATGKVAKRLWGENHRYLPLWPEVLNIDFDIAVPADVMAVLGLNQLPQGEEIGEDKSPAFTQKVDRPLRSGQGNSANESVRHEAGNSLRKNTQNNKKADHESQVYRDSTNGERSKETDNEFVYEEINKVKHVNLKEKKTNIDSVEKSVEKVFENLAKKMNQPDSAKMDARYPVYVIFSSRLALEKKYGPQQVGKIETALKNLQATIREKNNGWDAIIFYPDDADSADQYGLPPVVSSDPWKFKLSLTDLDYALSSKGKMVASVLIVGGPEIIPFHKLPNPTDDMDAEVFSDNPYATHDSNYFVPEWPVGRIPGDDSSHPSFLLQQIQDIITQHSNLQQNENIWSRFSYPFDEILRWFWNISRFSSLRIKKLKGLSDGFGYTAAIWRRASIAAYRPVGEADSVTVSPPTDSTSLNVASLLSANKGYFNLHGIENSGEWFGQRDTNDTSTSVDYPIAIKPEDITKNGSFPSVVFSEACYGAHITGKSVANAISLKFISIGTRAFIGSTCIAYGSVTTPLIGADLLGYIFWKLVSEGYKIGDAFTKAKIEFVKEMTKRQGYLDGEDQKTLISFILLGDPLATVQVEKQLTKARVSRSKKREQIKTICDNDMNINASRAVSRETLDEVKKNLEKYLPGIDDAKVSFSHQFVGYQEYVESSERNATRQKNVKLEKTGNVVVTVSKQVNVSKKEHHHYARVTLDQQGKMVKLALSR